MLNINKDFKKHEREWVLTDRKYSKVILANKDLGKLQKEAKGKKIKDAVIMFVPQFDAFMYSFAPLGWISLTPPLFCI